MVIFFPEISSRLSKRKKEKRKEKKRKKKSFPFHSAKDRVGHVTEVASDAVVLDNTPPSEGRVITGSFMGDNYLPGHMLHVRWEGITDLQSGVASQFVAVSMRGGHDDVISFTRVQGSSVTINGSIDLVDGHSYIVLLKVNF